MDGNQFDVLTRSIAKRLSRRNTFKALTAGLAASALSQVEVEPTEAARCQTLGKSCKKRRGKPRPRCCAGSVCRGNRCQCKPGRQQCGNKCITKKQCCRNNDCPNNQRCDQKTNKCGCGKNQKRCQGRCIPKSGCCTNADCGMDQICGPQNACVAAACSENGDCNSGACSCTPQIPTSLWPNLAFGVCQPDTYVNDFSSNLSGWFDFLDSVETDPGTWVNELFPPATSIELADGVAIVQPRNAYAPDFEKTALTTLGGFSDVFPENGYDVAIDIYLDPRATELEPLQRFGYTSALNKFDCSWGGDYAFEVGTNAAGNALCVYVHGDVDRGVDYDVCAESGSVNLTDMEGAEPGWYTFLHEFRNDGGYLKVTMTITPRGGAEPVFTATRPTNPTQTQISTRGGNRYAWFAFNSFQNGVRIDNIRRQPL